VTDIAKCSGQGCPISLEQTCWRYLAPCGERQNFISPESTVGGECPNYLPVRDYSKPAKAKTKAQKKSDRLALEELSDGIEPLEPVKKSKPVWKPKLGDVWKKETNR